MTGDLALAGFFDALADDDALALYDRAPCGYLSTSPDGVIVKVNRTFLTLTGYEQGDLVGHRRFVDLLTPGGRIYHETHYAPMLVMHDSAREIAFDIVRADGGRLPALVTAAMERSPDGTPRVIRAAVFDATSRRSYEQELLRAKRAAEESEARATALAKVLQQTLIPPTPPEIPGLEVAAVYRAAGLGAEVGGDFYDVFQVRDDEWMVAVGDVCGKGVGAAVVTSLVRHGLRAGGPRWDSPARVLESVNTALGDAGTGRFCTVVLLRLSRRPSGWSVAVSSGGHPLPIRLTTDGTAGEVGSHGMLLGVVKTARLHDSTVDLAPGEALFLYTDGVIEGRRAGELFGDVRLVSSVLAHRGSAHELAAGVVDDVLEFQSGVASDDIAVVVVRVPIGPAGSGAGPAAE